jgi:hypothetical protein
VRGGEEDFRFGRQQALVTRGFNIVQKGKAGFEKPAFGE